MNKVGIDINHTVNDSYYQYPLPLVSGVGPHKAAYFNKKIAPLVTVLPNGNPHVR